MEKDSQLLTVQAQADSLQQEYACLADAYDNLASQLEQLNCEQIPPVGIDSESVHLDKLRMEDQLRYAQLNMTSLKND